MQITIRLIACATWMDLAGPEGLIEIAVPMRFRDLCKGLKHGEWLVPMREFPCRRDLAKRSLEQYRCFMFWKAEYKGRAKGGDSVEAPAR